MYIKSGNRYFKIVGKDNKVIWTLSSQEAFRFKTILSAGDAINAVRDQYGEASRTFIDLRVVNEKGTR